jgi:hypothetical protein
MNHTATYSPEDNKLRLYPACRLDQDEYNRVKAAGFKWAPKQELFVAPIWTPEREDLLRPPPERAPSVTTSPAGRLRALWFKHPRMNVRITGLTEEMQ